MSNATCIHYTGKRLCSLGNVCDGDMPCYDPGKLYVPSTREDNPVRKCEICGEEFFPLNTRNVFCSKRCRDKKGYDVWAEKRNKLRSNKNEKNM